MEKTALLLLLFAACAAAAVPSWVQPGVVVVYDGISSGIQNGQPVNGVQTVVTLQVTSVSGNTVSGSANVVSPGIDPSVFQVNQQWSCTGGQPCGWRFWVDPADPAGSVKGPNGEPYSAGGPVSYYSPLGGPAVSGTNILYYANPDTHVEYHVTYEARTGLIVAYVEKYPSQQTYLYFRALNQDISGYQPPAQPAVPGAGNPCTPGLVILGLGAFALCFCRVIE